MQIAALVANEVPTSIPIEYSDFAEFFSLEWVSKLLEHTGINNHVIELGDDWPPLYGFIYNLGPVELETLKTYIKTNLANDFNKLSESTVGAPIFFDKKPDRNF